MMTETTERPFDVDKRPIHFGFLLLDNFTMMALASAVEPMRMANQLSGSALFSWSLLSHDGNGVKASDGIAVSPDCRMDQVGALDALIVVGGVNINNSFHRNEIEWLRGQARKGIMIGSLCTGAALLAESHLLDGYNASAHWECLASIKEKFPAINCNTRVFTIDRDRMTSSGGTAPLDMILCVVSQQFGASLSSAISEMLIYDRVRNQAEQQRVPLRHTLRSAIPKLVEIIELMENNTEEPIDLADLASYAGVSRRQLERLFHSYVGCTPSRYYLKIRLDRARQLLKQTSLPVVEVATACGFVSTPHFSRSYRKYMGVTPREERLGVWNDGELVETATAVLHDAEGQTVYDGMAKLPGAMAAARFEPSFGSVRLNGAVQ